MRAKLKGSTYSLIALMIIMLIVVTVSLRMEQFQSKMLPVVFGTLIFIIATVGVAEDIIGKPKTKVKASGHKKNESEGSEGWRGYLIAGLWLVGFFLAIYLIGFIIAIALLVATYMKTHGVKWLSTVIFTLATPIFIYFIFDYVFGTTLYLGLLFNLLGF